MSLSDAHISQSVASESASGTEAVSSAHETNTVMRTARDAAEAVKWG